MAVVLAPVTPKTPSGLFAAMALSPTCATGLPTAVPTLHFSPATPDDNSPFYPSSPSPSPTLPATSSTSGPPKPTHRSLASNEARQLTLLLTQHLFPVRNSHKGLMSESIVLAEKLHEAGLRWDTKRRVMGMHLRGIWEESQRLANGRTVGGHGPMDLYVQGSFLTIAEHPHPLDPMPIPIELHPASFAALPKLTLQAGLANSLPGATTLFEVMPLVTSVPDVANGYMSQMNIGKVVKRDVDMDMDMDVHGSVYGGGEAYSASGKGVGGIGGKGKMRFGWRERKKAGLKIKVEGPKSRLRTFQAQISTPTHGHPLSAHASTFATALRRTATRRSRGMFGLRLSLKTTGQRARGVGVWNGPLTGGGAKSARISFGGWEVR